MKEAIEKQSPPGLNRGLLSNFLVAEKCKPYAIYRRMSDLSEK